MKRQTWVWLVIKLFSYQYVIYSNCNYKYLSFLSKSTDCPHPQQDYTSSTCSRWREEPWDDPGKFTWFNMPLWEPKSRLIYMDNQILLPMKKFGYTYSWGVCWLDKSWLFVTSQKQVMLIGQYKVWCHNSMLTSKAILFWSHKRMMA